jgi:hypothetical protein
MILAFSFLYYVYNVSAIPFVGNVVKRVTAPSNLDALGETQGSPEFWWKLIISVVLVLAGGVFAG